MRTSSATLRSLLGAVIVSVLVVSCAERAPWSRSGADGPGAAPTTGAETAAPETPTPSTPSSTTTSTSAAPPASASVPTSTSGSPSVPSGGSTALAGAPEGGGEPTDPNGAGGPGPATDQPQSPTVDTRPPVTAGSSSPFALRGVIEGAYSVPYTHAQRTSMLTWMAAHRMNAYVHAPKLDAYADQLWRTPYPAPTMAEFTAEIVQAHQAGIDWIPALHPGADLCFSCATDRDALVAKFRPFVDAGSSRVMVGFDDVVAEGTTADRAIYGTGPAARGLMAADLLNALKAKLPGIDVLTVLSEYTGTAGTPYLTAVAQRLLPSIDVYWTGAGVVSPTITVAQAVAIDSVLGRHVVLWDNYPVNDYSGTAAGERRLNLGPSEGLEPGLGNVVQGVLANVQSPWATNLITLATLVDYLDRPARYEPESSWRAALDEVGGSDVVALTKLAENSRSSLIDPDESIVVGPMLEQVRAALVDGRRDIAAERDLRAELTAEVDAAQALRAGPDTDFASGAAPWIDVFEQNARAALLALDLAIATMPPVQLEVVAHSGHIRLFAGHVGPADAAATDAARARLQPVDIARRAAIAVTHGDRVGFPESVGPGNRIDRFVDAVLALPRPSGTTPSVLVDGQPAGLDFTVGVVEGATLDVIATDESGARTHITF
ncbi:MAG: beta-N-acetylglucosaminidase domain-containing protein [Acidimicrobiales bacterium]